MLHSEIDSGCIDSVASSVSICSKHSKVCSRHSFLDDGVFFSLRNCRASLELDNSQFSVGSLLVLMKNRHCIAYFDEERAPFFVMNKAHMRLNNLHLALTPDSLVFFKRFAGIVSVLRSQTAPCLLWKHSENVFAEVCFSNIQNLKP